MTHRAGPEWLRLSEACHRLRAAGVGDVDLLATIARAGLQRRFVAKGFQSVRIGRDYRASPDRLPIRQMMWRVLCSPKAEDKGYKRWIDGDDLIWTRGDHIDDVTQEVWRSVFVDVLSFEGFLADRLARAAPPKLTPEETEEWIREYPGTNSKTGWDDYQRYYGARAAKRELVFQPAWIRVHERSKGRPRKSPATT